MLLIGMPGWAEWAIIAFIVLLLFGKNRLPDLAKSMGSGIREFKKGISGHYDEASDEEVEESTAKTKTASIKATGSKSPASGSTSKKKSSKEKLNT